jgi:hypothetical protein
MTYVTVNSHMPSYYVTVNSHIYVTVNNHMPSYVTVVTYGAEVFLNPLVGAVQLFAQTVGALQNKGAQILGVRHPRIGLCITSRHNIK